MPDGITYFPALTSRESECQALRELAEPTKDRLFPLIRLQAWPRSKQGAGTPIARSVEHITDSLGTRRLAVDLAAPRNDLTSDWAVTGRAEVAALRDPSGGFDAWCRLVQENGSFIPTLQWSDDIASLRAQAVRLMNLGRGLVVRFRRTHSWNLAQAANLHGLSLESAPLLLVFDCEQIGLRDDLTSMGLSAQNATLAVNNLFPSSDQTFVLLGSSFPSEFASIDAEHAVLDIRERILFEMIRTSMPLRQAGIELRYGDHASVFAAEREPAFRGAPRVDYPTTTNWVYHRCAINFETAVARVRNDVRWNEQLLCWGAQRIRTAAAGNMTGLNAPRPWTTVRINIHLHIQAHHDEGCILPVDELWKD